MAPLLSASSILVMTVLLHFLLWAVGDSTWPVSGEQQQIVM